MRPTLKKNIVTDTEFNVLKILYKRYLSNKNSSAIEISQIAVESGVKDNDEILRALYTLEGRSLVSPEPEGVFTSKMWKITEFGVKAYDLALSQ